MCVHALCKLHKQLANCMSRWPSVNATARSRKTPNRKTGSTGNDTRTCDLDSDWRHLTDVVTPAGCPWLGQGHPDRRTEHDGLHNCNQPLLLWTPVVDFAIIGTLKTKQSKFETTQQRDPTTWRSNVMQQRDAATWRSNVMQQRDAATWHRWFFSHKTYRKTRHLKGRRSSEEASR